MLCNKNKRIRGASRKQGWTFIYLRCFHRVTFRKNPVDNIANTDLDRIYEFHVILASVSGWLKVLQQYCSPGRKVLLQYLFSGIWKGEGWKSRRLHRFWPSYLLLERILKNLRSANLLANRRPYLLFILSQSKADM